MQCRNVCANGWHHAGWNLECAPINKKKISLSLVIDSFVCIQTYFRLRIHRKSSEKKRRFFYTYTQNLTKKKSQIGILAFIFLIYIYFCCWQTILITLDFQQNIFRLILTHTFRIYFTISIVTSILFFFFLFFFQMWLANSNTTQN